MMSRRRAGCALRELSALFVDRDDRVAALVRVDPDDHHDVVSFRFGGARSGSAGGHIPVGATPRSSQATPAGPTSVVRAAQRTPATKAIRKVERARTTG